MTLYIGWDANQNVGHGGYFSLAVEKKNKKHSVSHWQSLKSVFCWLTTFKPILFCLRMPEISDFIVKDAI